MGYVYPSSPVPVEGMPIEDEFLTYGTEYPSGRTVTVAARQYPLFRVSLRYGPALLESDFQPVLELFRRVKGRSGTFAFFDFVDAAHVRLPVGVGTGAQPLFDLPLFGSATRTIYVAGVTTTAYTFSAGGGTDGRDKITFTSAPAAGALVEIDGTGKRVVQCRFGSDSISFRRYSPGLIEAEVQIVEAR